MKQAIEILQKEEKIYKQILDKWPAGYQEKKKANQKKLEEIQKAIVKLKQENLVHIHEGVSNIHVYTEEGVVHIKPTPTDTETQILYEAAKSYMDNNGFHIGVQLKDAVFTVTKVEQGQEKEIHQAKDFTSLINFLKQ